MLVTIRGVVRDGKVDLQETGLPDGTEVVILTEKLPSIEAQKRRLEALSQAEWEGPFLEYIKLSEEYPDEDISKLSDEEIVAIIHDVRAEKL